MPARSKSQQRLFGMVHAYQKGKLKDAPESIKAIASSISEEDAEHFAKTRHKGLPEKKAEDKDIEAKARLHYPDEGSHGWNHIQDVIASARRMRRRDLLKKELAAIMYHDSSLMTGDRETHAEDSAEIARRELAVFFRKKQLDDIVNAIAHHRASYKGKRSSRLEDLVAAADRPVPNLARQIARSWKYHEELGEPEDLRASNVASHLKEKYGHGGYAYSNAPKLYTRTYGDDLKKVMNDFDALTPESVLSIVSGKSKKQDKNYRISGAILGCLGDNAKNFKYVVDEDLPNDPWKAIISSKGNLSLEDVEDWHRNHVVDVDKKNVPYYFMVKNTSNGKEYVLFGGDKKWYPIDTNEGRAAAVESGLKKGIPKEQLDFVKSSEARPSKEDLLRMYDIIQADARLAKNAEDKSDRLKRARAFVLAVKKMALKRKLNMFLVTDGASGIMNNGNPAVRNAREAQIKWELEHGADPYEDWEHTEKKSEDTADLYGIINARLEHIMNKSPKYSIAETAISKMAAGPVQPRPVSQKPQRPSGTPIGYWNNNPGNLLSDGRTLWEGAPKVQPKGENLEFSDYGSGYRAMARTLYNYKAKHGLDTLQAILARYAKSATAAKRAKYEKFVNGRTGWKPGAKIDLTNTDTLQKIVPAMASFEIGPKFTAYHDPTVVSNSVLRAIPPK